MSVTAAAVSTQQLHPAGSVLPRNSYKSERRARALQGPHQHTAAPGYEDTSVRCSHPLHPMRHRIPVNLQKQAVEKTLSIKEHK